MYIEESLPLCGHNEIKSCCKSKQGSVAENSKEFFVTQLLQRMGCDWENINDGDGKRANNDTLLFGVKKLNANL